jgi:glycosyltransferase involved in cell wall biosynthesis
MIRFSVVVPMFNSRFTIERALTSAIGQGYQPSEVILVDDGSSDDTLAVVASISAGMRKPPVRVIALGANQGPAYARNVGWEAAQGDYVAFLDADDEWFPEKLRVQAQLLNETRAVLLGQRYPSLQRGGPPVAKVGRRQILMRNMFWTPTVVIRRDIPERFPELMRYCEDHLLYSVVTLRYDRSYHMSRAVIHEHKLPLAEAGLSRSLVRMQWGSWQTYRELRRRGHISASEYMFYELLSTAKFAVRPLRVLAWRMKARRRKSLVGPSLA